MKKGLFFLAFLTVLTVFAKPKPMSEASVTNAPQDQEYCIPIATNPEDYISDFSTSGGNENINNINSGFSDNGYGDFTDMVVSQVQGGTIDFQVTHYGSPFAEFFGFRIWVDWNQDGVFDTEEEVAFVSSDYGVSHSGTITVPIDAIPGNTRMRIVNTKLNYSGDISPCHNWHDAGEFEDYTFEVVELEDCEGIPTAGEVKAGFGVCAENPFVVNVTDTSIMANGLTRQWQSSPAAADEWTDIEGATNPSYTVSEGILEPTDYRFVVTCEFSDQTDISDVIPVTVNDPLDCYCLPVYINGCDLGDVISNVTLIGENITLDNDSECSAGGYGDYTGYESINVPDVFPGETYTLSIYTNVAYPEYRAVKAWIDYNDNGEYEEDEALGQGEFQEDGLKNLEFTVPEGIEPSQYRMRVRMAMTADTDPCASENYGETEDYMIEVSQMEGCEGPVSAGEINEDDFEICALSSFTLSVSGASNPSSGLTRQWESSPAGEDNWTAIEGADSNVLSMENGIEEATDFRFVVTCTTNEESDISESITVSLKELLDCYCIPSHNYSTDYYINNFKTIGALVDIDNDSEPGDTNYTDYTETHIIVAYAGQEIDFSISGNDDLMNYEGWVDYNLDGNFLGDNEHIISSDNYVNSPFTGTFQVPVDLEEGSYRLRIRTSMTVDVLDPCESDATGETEDYMLEIIVPDCYPPVNIEINYVEDTSAQIVWLPYDGNSWEVIYGEAGFDPETEGESVVVSGDPVANLTNLNHNTTYEVYVRTICEDSNSLFAPYVSFTTEITPPENSVLCNAIPLEANADCEGGPYTNLGAFAQEGEPAGSCLSDFQGTNSVWFSFVAPANGMATITTNFSSTNFSTELVAYEAPEDCEDLSTLGAEVGCATANEDLELEDLVPGAVYYVKVAGFNNAEGNFCIEVQTDEDTSTCEDPSDIVVTDVEDTYATVEWTANGSETQWEVAYGLAGFDLDTEGQTEVVDTNSIVLTDLVAETDYDVYVRALCNENLSSDWVGPENFTTKPMSVASEIFNDFSYYPNPVQEVLTLKATAQIEKVEVFNLLGQLVLKTQPNTLDAQLNTEQLQSGAYLMRVSIDGATKTFRIIKK